jgi:hypothetical protein
MSTKRKRGELEVVKESEEFKKFQKFAQDVDLEGGEEDRCIETLFKKCEHCKSHCRPLKLDKGLCGKCERCITCEGTDHIDDFCECSICELPICLGCVWPCSDCSETICQGNDCNFRCTCKLHITEEYALGSCCTYTCKSCGARGCEQVIEKLSDGTTKCKGDHINKEKEKVEEKIQS